MLYTLVRMVFPKYLFKTHICTQPLQPSSSNITSYVKPKRIILLTLNYKYSWIYPLFRWFDRNICYWEASYIYIHSNCFLRGMKRFLLVHKPKHGQVPFFSFSKYLLHSTRPGDGLWQIWWCELGKSNLLQWVTILSWFYILLCKLRQGAPDLHENQETFKASPSAAPDPLLF